ncbi:NUDIX domain-containing protein [Candidatus Parcubacteria bacterium]|nr:MAG: NUDIX domain-containing protein [Candidatus Parcubacteria bacterium]
MMPKKDYAVFGIIEGVFGGIPLVIDKKEGFHSRQWEKWKLPGGSRDESEISPAYTLMREIGEEIGIVMEDSAKEVFRRNMGKHDFLVYAVRYYSGELKAGEEIKAVKIFSLPDVEKMIEEGKILKNHADALSSYIGKRKSIEELIDAFVI